jgi:hypothetical protein
VEGLVGQLQADALDQSVSVCTLLRKVKVAAVKLGLSDTVEWADNELKGYTENVPAYRMIRGRCKAFDPYQGWSVVGGKADVIEALSKRALGQSISSLEEVISSDKDDLMITIAPAIAESIISSNPGCRDVALFLSRGSIVSIIDHVRNMVLDWALDLEKAGIKGEGLTFSTTEQRRAEATPMNIQIDGANARLNIGSINHSSNAVSD